MVRAKTLEGNERRHVLVFGEGDELHQGLLHYVREHGLASGSFSGIGAFRRVELRYFDWATKVYESIPLDEQVELLTLTGNIAVLRGEPVIHAHLIVGRRDGTAWRGHLASAIVRPTAEIVLVETSSELRRQVDDFTGLPLIVSGTRT